MLCLPFPERQRPGSVARNGERFSLLPAFRYFTDSACGKYRRRRHRRKCLPRAECGRVRDASAGTLPGFRAASPHGPFPSRTEICPRKDAGVTFGMLLQLQGLGIISGVEAIGMISTIGNNSRDRYIKALLCHGRGLFVEHDDANKTFNLGVYLVTNLGSK